MDLHVAYQNLSYREHSRQLLVFLIISERQKKSDPASKLTQHLDGGNLDV